MYTHFMKMGACLTHISFPWSLIMIADSEQQKDISGCPVRVLYMRSVHDAN